VAVLASATRVLRIAKPPRESGTPSTPSTTVSPKTTPSPGLWFAAARIILVDLPTATITPLSPPSGSREDIMKFNFFKWSNGEWAVQHPDTVKLGFGKTKLAAALDLRAIAGITLSIR